MYIHLEANTPLLQEFTLWTETHSHEIGDVISLGYLLHKHGFLEHYKSQLLEEKMPELRSMVDKVKADKEIEIQASQQRYETLLANKDTMIQALKKQIDDLQYDMKEQLKIIEEPFHKKYEADMERIKAQETILRLQETNSLHSQVIQYKMQVENLQKELESYMKGVQQCRISELERDIDAKQRMIDMMSKTNYMKGNYGEMFIQTLLRNSYPSYHYVDVSKQAHAADLKMFVSESSKEHILIECKNKGAIVKDDIDKFIYDIEQSITTETTNLLGALFISTRTKNIPYKGDMHIEMHKHVVVMYLGFEEEQEIHDFLPHFMKILFSLIKHQKTNDTLNQSSLSDILEKIKPCTNHIQRIKTKLTKMKKNLIDMSSYVKEMEDDSSNILLEIEHLLGKHNTTSTLSCATCKKVFKTKQGLTKHVSSCS